MIAKSDCADTSMARRGGGDERESLRKPKAKTPDAPATTAKPKLIHERSFTPVTVQYKVLCVKYFFTPSQSHRQVQSVAKLGTEIEVIQLQAGDHVLYQEGNRGLIRELSDVPIYGAGNVSDDTLTLLPYFLLSHRLKFYRRLWGIPLAFLFLRMPPLFGMSWRVAILGCCLTAFCFFWQVGYEHRRWKQQDC
jgi:hypothetical protein